MLIVEAEKVFSMSVSKAHLLKLTEVKDHYVVGK